MMFRWEPDMVRFMRDASGYGDYHALLAGRIARRLPPGARVCDAGCGLGYLTRALAPLCGHVTALDLSENALAVAREITAPLKNVSVVCADMDTYVPEAPFDAMVFCFFGRTEEILRFAGRACRGRVIVVKKNWTHHRFTLGQKPLMHSTLSEMEAFLSGIGVPFESETLTLEFGQPLRSEADAVRFFRLYSRDERAETITLADIEPRLERRDDPTFPLYLPEQKRLGILSFDAGTIPGEITIAQQEERYYETHPCRASFAAAGARAADRLHGSARPDAH